MLRPWTQAARSLARRAGFTLSAIGILAAGIAATTGVFTVVNTAVLAPLPYPNPDRLVVVLEANSAKTDAAGLVAPARLEDWNRRNHTFEALAASYAENVTETSGDVPERLASRRITPRYFTVFQRQPSVGRTFVAEEELSGGTAAVVISDHLWTRRFARRIDITSQHLTLAGRSYAIVGVMPADFDDNRVELWIPAQIAPPLMQARDARFMTGVGRMKLGVTIAAAQRDLAQVQMELAREFPATDKNWSAQLTDLKATRVGQYRDPLVFILGAVTLLLLIALANTAGLMLTQLQRREGELAIRGFLGATRGQVVAGVIQEVLIIALAATVVAVIADVVLLRVASSALSSLPRTNGLGIDWRALLVASTCGAMAAVICGGVPAWRATRRGAAAMVSRAGRGISSDTRSQRLLVGGQIAIATLLLSSTGLMLRSYYNLSYIDPGFDAAHAATFHVGAAWDEDRKKVSLMQQQLLTTLASLPGVTAVGFSNFLPASNATIRYQVRFDDGAPTEGSADRAQLAVGERGITRDYFRALGARLLSGGSCPDLGSVQDATPKALVNRRFANAYANGGNVVGRHLSWVQERLSPPMEIVGVVDDIREDNLRAAAVPYLYVCLNGGNWPDPEYVVRTAGDPAQLLASIRSVVHGIDASRAVFGDMPLEQSLSSTIGNTRLQTQMIAIFGIAAVALAVVGLYGLVALAVTTRRREIGIRIALGAEPGRVVRELTARVAWLIVGGTAVGLLLTMIAQRQLRAVVFGVAPLDPLTLGGAVIGLAVAAGIAAFVPASRAAKIDPVGAMRES
ncbi:MAG TPA: ABC transporter permease [Gemmatimonadaceae bacterium]|jgi:putative ABC transport system permease protein